MEQLKLRIAMPEDAKEITDWLFCNPHNAFDPSILKYPTYRAITSYGQNGSVAHMPSQQALILESVAMSPGASPPEKAQALRDLVKGQELLATSFGLREIYFIASDPAVQKIAEDHGFERIGFPVVRLKL